MQIAWGARQTSWAGAEYLRAGGGGATGNGSAQLLKAWRTGVTLSSLGYALAGGLRRPRPLSESVEESMSYDSHGVIDLELLDDAIEEVRSSRSPAVRVQQLLLYIEDLHQLIVRNDEHELKIERRKLR